MDAEFVSFAAVMTQSHLYLPTQALMSNLSSRKDLVVQQFSFTGHLECTPLCLLSSSLQILRVVCVLCPFFILPCSVMCFMISTKNILTTLMNFINAINWSVSSLQPKHCIALHIKCPCLWMNHRLDSFIEKICTVPDMNSHEIPAVGVEIQPKDYNTHYVKFPYFYTDCNEI